MRVGKSILAMIVIERAMQRLARPASRRGWRLTALAVMALPLLPVQAAELVAVAERAPYGRGADTLIDTHVRRTWPTRCDPSPAAG